MQLLCIGDVAISTMTSPWIPPAGIMPGAEVRLLFNWEFPIGETINPIPRTSGPRLLSHPQSVNTIRKWAPGFAALATNHILDSGGDGLSMTIEALHQAGFETVGGGLSTDEIERPLLWDTNEGQLAIVNWVFPETHPDWMSVPGPNCWPGIDEAKSLIRDLKREVDWVLVFAHWSDELFPYPRPEDRETARELADAGLDILVGHHPHVVRGMEICGKCPVIYSIGNFYFADKADPNTGREVRQVPRNQESLGVHIEFHHGTQPEIRFLSFWQKNDKCQSDSLQRSVRRMKSVSRPLFSFQPTKYSEWYAGRRVRFNRWEYRWLFRLQQMGLSGLYKYLSQRSH